MGFFRDGQHCGGLKIENKKSAATRISCVIIQHILEVEHPTNHHESGDRACYIVAALISGFSKKCKGVLPVNLLANHTDLSGIWFGTLLDHSELFGTHFGIFLSADQNPPLPGILPYRTQHWEKLAMS